MSIFAYLLFQEDCASLVTNYITSQIMGLFLHRFFHSCAVVEDIPGDTQKREISSTRRKFYNIISNFLCKHLNVAHRLNMACFLKNLSRVRPNQYLGGRPPEDHMAMNQVRVLKKIEAIYKPLLYYCQSPTPQIPTHQEFNSEEV